MRLVFIYAPVCWVFQRLRIGPILQCAYIGTDSPRLAVPPENDSNGCLFRWLVGYARKGIDASPAGSKSLGACGLSSLIVPATLWSSVRPSIRILLCKTKEPFRGLFFDSSAICNVCPHIVALIQKSPKGSFVLLVPSADRGNRPQSLSSRTH